MILDEHEQMIIDMFFDGLRPIERMTVSQWANKFRMLTSTSSSEPGPYRFERTPYLRKVMDYLGITSDMQEIYVMKGAQLGFTDAGNNWIGYNMHIDPGPFMLIMPTEAALKKNSRTRIEPMIEGTPVLKERTGRKGDKGSVNTILEKEYPGGFLMMVAAQSPVGLSSTPVGKVMMDEIDRYPASAGSEGSPIELARARTRTFQNKKIFGLSTPTLEGASAITTEFETGNKEYYFVPCLHCDQLFVLRFELLTWEEGKPETARMACPECGGLHEERHKTKMLAEKGHSPEGKAEWIATAVSDNPKKVTMHLSGLYSPAGMYSWESVVRDYLNIKGDVNKEISFTNTVLAETYKVKGDAPDDENLYNRRESYAIGTVPDPVCFLTMGVDVQQNRLELEVVGWCPGKSTYSIEYKVLHGDTAKPEVWEDLRAVINHQYPCDDGSVMPITLTCIDAGYNTKKVYDFTAGFSYTKVIPIMGRDSVKTVMVSSPIALNVTKTGNKIKGAKVWYLGTSLLKSELYGFLKLKATGEDGATVYPDGYCHFPEYDRNYFKMLTAEELRVVKNKKGYDEFIWVKVFERNEALDVRCYARAAAFIFGMDRFKETHWDRMKERTRIAPTAVNDVVVQKPKPKPTKRGGYWDKK